MKQVVLDLLAEGKTTPEIAWATGVSLQYINKVKREETDQEAVKGRPRIESPEEKRTLYLYKSGRLSLDIACATLNMSEQTFKRRLKDYRLDQADSPNAAVTDSIDLDELALKMKAFFQDDNDKTDP
jgi:hypothetical protein